MKNAKTINYIQCGIFAALTAIGAFIQVPLGFTSITLQTMMTILAGVILGPKWGALSQTIYVVLGLIGVPIFTKGGGIGYLLQPSMGFLIALIPAAYIAGVLTKSAFDGKKWLIRMIIACVASEFVMYLIGTPYMGAVLNMHMKLGYSAAKIFQVGCLLYLPGDLVKCIITIIIVKPLVKALDSAGLRVI
ncbi:MAG: biotin transporter BioY [Clostridia bacterium]|nr:biotin transporter BioY [Clostridia bacterium]